MQCAGARQADTGALADKLADCSRRARLRGPGLSTAAVAMVDDRWGLVMARARFRQRERCGAEGAFGGNTTDDPVGPAATGAVIHFMLPVDRVVATFCRIMLQTQIAKAREVRHVLILSGGLNGRTPGKVS